MSYKEKEWPFNLLDDLVKTTGLEIELDQLPEDFSGSLEYVLCSFPDRRRTEMLRLRYQKHMTFAEIGDIFGVSRECARYQIALQLREIQTPYWMKYLRYGVQGVIEQQLQRQQEIYQQRIEKEIQLAVEAAQEAKNEAEKAERYNSLPIEDRILLTELKLDARAQNCLRRRDMKTVGDILCLDYKEFEKIRNLGEKTRMRILAEVEKLGFDCEHLKEPINILTK